MANFGGFLQALGQAFGGYGQDQQTRFARQQATQRMGLDQRTADDAHTNAQLERAVNYPLLSANGTSPLPNLPGMESFPTGRVDVDGYGAVDPFGKLRLATWSEGLKRRVDTDEKIREAQATGVIDKNAADTNKANAESSPDFYGQRAGAEELAKLPTLARLEVLRGNISLGNALAAQNARFGNEVTLQGNEHQFEQEKQGRQFQFDADKAARELSGRFVNESALANQRAQGTLSGKLFAPAPMTTAPSTSQTLPRLAPEQVLRAAREPQYKQFLEAQGYALSGGQP